jgi:NUMOD4 motif
VDNITERWKPYPGFAGFYEVSDLGNVYSLPRATTSGGIREAYVNVWGYRTVNLSKYGRIYYRRVGRMVLETWVSQCPPGCEACHGPGGPLDDSLHNLCWGSKASNHGPDRLRDGTTNRGENCATAKLTSVIVAECRRRVRSEANPGGETQLALATEFGVTQPVMSRAIRGITWADAPGTIPAKPVIWTSLTEEIVLECRRRVRSEANPDGETQIALSREFGVYYGALNRAIRGLTWGHLTEGILETDGRVLPVTPELRERRQEFGRKGAEARWG